MAKEKKKSRARRERVFEPIPSGNRVVVIAMGVVGAMAMGAGVYGQFVGVGSPAHAFEYAPWILAGGAILVGAAIWFGWSGEPALRVGDAGIATERGTIRRMPWYAVESVSFSGNVVKVVGRDETEQPLTVLASLKSQPQAAAWIVREARARIPDVLELPEGAPIPTAFKSSGTLVTLEAVQVVGKKCAASGKVIAYEPDARLCTNCDRVYHKASVPETCVCGAPMKAKPKEVPTISAEEAVTAEAAKADEEPKKEVTP